MSVLAGCLLAACGSDPTAHDPAPFPSGETETGWAETMGDSGNYDPWSTENPPDDSLPGRLRQELLDLLAGGASTEEMLPVARQRREVLRSGWSAGTHYGPGALFLPDERDLFPEPVRAILEVQTAFTGSVNVHVVDFPDHAEERSVLSANGTQREFLGLPASSESLATGWVNGAGWQTDDFLFPTELEALPPTAGNGGPTSFPPTAHVLAIAAQLTAGVENPNADFDLIAQNLVLRDDSAASYFDEMSSGAVELLHDQTAGPYPLYEAAPEERECLPGAWADTLDQAARADGHDLESYDYILYYVPTAGTNCVWAGRAHVFSTAEDPVQHAHELKRAWIRSTEVETVTHEVGHLFGLRHAGRAACSADALPDQLSDVDDCPFEAYGSDTDVMGDDYHALNAAHMAQLGWLDGGEPQLTSITPQTRGDYRLTPVHDGGDSRKLLRIPVDSQNDLTLSYRTGLTSFEPEVPTEHGVEVTLAANISADELTEIGTHYEAVADSSDTVRLDVDGQSTLRDGADFWHFASGVRATQLDHDTEGATVRVDFLQREQLGQDPDSEYIEDVAAGAFESEVLLGELTESVLVLSHQARPEIPGGSPHAAGVLGRQHTQLMATVGSWFPGFPKSASDAVPLFDTPAPTEFATRVDLHAAATFAPHRESYIVAATQRVDVGEGEVHHMLRLAEVRPPIPGLAPVVVELSEVDLGTFWVEGEQNPLVLSEAEIDLVSTPDGFVFVIGHGGDQINTPGDHLLLGTFSLSEEVEDTSTDVAIRVLPSTHDAKWPSLAVGQAPSSKGEQPVVALTWTQAFGPIHANRIAALGFLPASDEIFAPGAADDPATGANEAIAVVEDSASVTPAQLVASTGASGFNVFNPAAAFDPGTGRFHLSYTQSGGGFDWEVRRTSFRAAPGEGHALADGATVSIPRGEWNYGGDIAINADGIVAIVHAEDGDPDPNDDASGFFDDLARIRVAFHRPTETQGNDLLSDALLQEAYRDYTQVRIAALNDVFYVARSGPDGIVVDALDPMTECRDDSGDATQDTCPAPVALE